MAVHILFKKKSRVRLNKRTIFFPIDNFSKSPERCNQSDARWVKGPLSKATNWCYFKDLPTMDLIVKVSPHMWMCLSVCRSVNSKRYVLRFIYTPLNSVVIPTIYRGIVAEGKPSSSETRTLSNVSAQDEFQAFTSLLSD